MVAESKPAPYTFAAAIGGSITPLLFAAAIMADGHWTFDYNSLSDLGISSNSAVAALFNYTCMFSGLCAIIFGFGKFKIQKGYDSASGLCIMIGGLFLIGVGIFTKDSIDIHLAVAFGYFLVSIFAIILSAIGAHRSDRYLTLAATVTLIVVSICTIPAFTYTGMEVIFVLVICAWSIIQGFTLSFSKH